ncbi:MAG: NADH-ubiquinone oxidoreductase-F iron-sulfur binding region domain-containing protein [Mobilitalea sp.]
MSEYIICNLVPTYKEAPVSLELLSDQSSYLIDALTSNTANQKYIVLDKENKSTQTYVKELEAIPGITLVQVTEKEGFVFGNKTAVVKVVNGEKPLPTGVDRKLPVYSVEELLKKEEKTFFLGGNAKTKGKYTFAKIIKPRVILEGCGSLKEFKGMYFGYPMGNVIGAGQLEEEIEIRTDYVHIFDETDCILDQLVKIAARYSKESCGRCVYGYEGVTQIAMILSEMSQKKGKSEDIELLMDLCSRMQTQSLCEVGTSAATTVQTALVNFKEEIEEHITKKNCRAVVCEKFVTYHILPDLCTGCNECVDSCQDDAILGKKKFIHVIDLEECIQCGACVSACEEGAIIKAGANKPKGPKKPIPCK